MKIGIIFFSGTRNTKWVAEYFHSNIKSKGILCDIFNIERNQKNDFTDYSHVIIAHPIYGANIPPIVLRKFKSCSFNDNVKISVIATFGYVNAFGPFKESKELGIKIHSYINIKMFNNITTPKLKSNVVPLIKRIKAKKNIEKKMNKKIEYVVNEKRIIDGIGPYLIPGKIIKRIGYNGIVNHYKSLSVDKNLCINCLKCVKDCPTKALKTIDQNIVIDSSCTACMRCYNNCPTSAILVNGIFADPSIFIRFHGPWS